MQFEHKTLRSENSGNTENMGNVSGGLRPPDTKLSALRICLDSVLERVRWAPQPHSGLLMDPEARGVTELSPSPPVSNQQN